MTKVYGSSDNLIEIEGDLTRRYNVYGPPITLLFSEGTLVTFYYTPDDVWKVAVRIKGTLFYSIDICDESDGPTYSDMVHFNDGLQWSRMIDLMDRG